MMISGGIPRNGFSESKVDPCGVCSLRVKANSVFCVQCDECIHSRCACVKRVTAKFSKNLLAGNVKGILERQSNRKKVM